MKQIVHKSSYHAIRPCTFLTIDSIQPYALYALVLPSSHFLTCALKVPGVLKATLRHDLSILRYVKFPTPICLSKVLVWLVVSCRIVQTQQHFHCDAIFSQRIFKDSFSLFQFPFIQRLSHLVPRAKVSCGQQQDMELRNPQR